MPIQVNWNSSVVATDTGSMVKARDVQHAGGARSEEPSPSKDSTRLGDSGTGRLPKDSQRGQGDGEQQRAEERLAGTVWVHENPSASIAHLIVAAIPP